MRGERSTNGIRVPASDLELLVINGIVSHLGDPIWVSQQLGSALGPVPMQRLLEAAAMLAKALTDGSGAPSIELVRRLISRVILGDRSIAIGLDRHALCRGLGEIAGRLSATSSSEVPLQINLEARALRCGKQVRLMVGEAQSTTRSPDHALIALITDAHRWFEDLRSGSMKTIAAIAERDHQQVSHVSRTIGLAFLAPDIVEMILAGRQPITLTPERLKACRPLPGDWNEQRELFLG